MKTYVRIDNNYPLQVKQRLEYEKEELHNVIADLEEKFKLETDKVAKLQVEIQNVRVSMEKALRAKEEELEKMRRDLLREMEQIQSNLEIEIKLKNDALKIKKKLEMEYKELEYTLETANKTIADYLREIKKLEAECGNLQVGLFFCLDDGLLNLRNEPGNRRKYWTTSSSIRSFARTAH